MARQYAVSLPTSIFHRTADHYAVSYIRGSILTIKTYRERLEAWDDFMTYGRDPACHSVNFIKHPGVVDG